MRHLAFFRAASTEVEGSSEYRTLLAGLVVIRLLDKWRSRNRDPERQVREFAPVQQAVAAIDDNPDARRALQDLIDAIGAFIEGIADTRVARLADYAWSLERDARWDPAADVYLTAIELAPPDRASLPRCYRHVSGCFRKLGDLDRAEQLMRDGQRVAAEIGDLGWSLRLRITEAKLFWYRGDLRAAERVLDDIIAEADDAGLTTVAAAARQDRGAVASEGNQKELGAQYCYAAIKGFDEPSEKIRAMGDLGVMLQDLGYIEQAWTLFLTVYHSPHTDVETRNYALLNMLYGSTLVGEQPQFDWLSDALRDQRLDARQRASYHVFRGQGYLKFAEPWRAQVEFAEAVVVARENGISRFRREAEVFLTTGLEGILDDIRNHRGEFERPPSLGLSDATGSQRVSPS